MKGELDLLLEELKNSKFSGRDTRFDENIFGGVFFEYAPNRLVRKDKRFSQPTKLIDRVTYNAEFIPKKIEQTQDKEKAVMDNKIEIYYCLSDMLELLQNDPRFILTHALKIQRKSKNTYKVLFYRTARDAINSEGFRYAHLKIKNGRLDEMRIEQVYGDHLLEGYGSKIKFSYHSQKE